MKAGVLDHPDGDRKTQAAPVPRLGGLGILLGAFIAGALYPMSQMITGNPQALAAFDPVTDWVEANWQVYMLTVGAVLLGLWDDVTTAPTVIKLGLLGALCIALPIAGLIPEALHTPWGNLETPLALLIAGSAAWLLVFVNAANFMDGSNGLSIGSLGIMSAGLMVVGAAQGAFGFTLWWFALFGGIAGFLALNLKGKLYAGDAGALGLGALFAALALVSDLNVWTIGTLALPFLVDVLLTLIWRAKHGRSWLKAHRDHAYQSLIERGWSHFETALLWWGLSAVCAVAALIAARATGAAPFIVFWGLAAAMTLLWIVERHSDRRE